MGKLRFYDAVVLAGGSARRFGGTDKVLAAVAGRSMLERVLAAVGGARQVYVVGPRRPVRLPARPRGSPAGADARAGSDDQQPDPGAPRWLREDPPGSGPLAGLAAAAGLCRAPVVVAVGADMPLLTRAVIDRLVADVSRPDTDAALLTDAEGRWQPMAAAYRRPALTAALEAVGETRDKGFAPLLRRLRVATTEDARAATDCDTPADLDRVERLMLTDWTQRLAAELGITDDLGRGAGEPARAAHAPGAGSGGDGTPGSGPGLDLDLILDLARDAAHAVDRPAAPVTTFLVGYAAARRGGGAEAIAECARIARELASTWQ